MTNKIKTIRESIDAYRQTLPKTDLNGYFEFADDYPHDNHPLAMKIGSERLKGILQGSGQFNIRIESKYGQVKCSVIDCLPTNTSVLIDHVDEGGEDRNYLCKEWGLEGGWLPATLHARSGGFGGNISTINTLEVLLDLAEKYKIPMVTEHVAGGRGEDGRTIRYLVNFGETK